MDKDTTIKLIEELNNNKTKEKILLHTCCGPCMSGVYYQLNEYFDIVSLYYNPNIYPFEEYQKRYDNLIKLSNILGFKVKEIGYDEQVFLDKVKGYEDLKEGSYRCMKCFELRLEESVKYAKENNIKYFTTTLSVSPYKNADWLNELGESLEKKYGVKYLYSNFKKKEGYKNSISFSKKYGLYRQEYCGCRFSLNEKKND